MREFANCLGEHAIKVSDTTCSGSSSQNSSFPKAVTCLYKSKISDKKFLLITVTWCKNMMGQGLFVHVGNDPWNHNNLDPNSKIPWLNKGSKKFDSCDCKIKVIWDISYAKYEIGPEPISGFYLVVIADSKLAILLGSLSEEMAAKKFNARLPISQFNLIARKEHVLGKKSYSTKSQFWDRGIIHDIIIKCEELEGDMKEPELSVSIDRKKVIHVKRLKWKFRGNQTIFVDGLPVDLMWDVHDWFFNPKSGSAVFMFKTRKDSTSRLWLEEEVLLKDRENLDFSLLIYACKCP